MATKVQFSLPEKKKDMPKQIGCMYGIFQLFDRQNSLTSRLSSFHNNKRLLLGAGHHSDPQHARKDVLEDVDVKRENQRVFNDSSRASDSSSCSSAFSSLGTKIMPHQESLPPKQTTVPQSPMHAESPNEYISLTKGANSLDLRDVVMGSMYREVRVVPIKFQSKDERRGHVLKHVDSPRPLQKSKSRKAEGTAYDGTTHILSKSQQNIKISKDERLALPRFSYDERESRSREAFKSSIKLKELPRLSLDSRASSLKGSLLDSRSNHLRRDLQMENKNQEPESHYRTSNVVAKLMGLDNLLDSVSTDENRITKTKENTKDACLSRSSTTEETKQYQVSISPRVSQNNFASSSPRLHGANSVRNVAISPRIPLEPAPWRQQDSNQGSEKMAPWGSKVATVTTHPSPSVYGEIQKRASELEFRNSGKDLRALKQILEAMMGTRDKLENHKSELADLKSERRCRLNDRFSDKSSCSLMRENRKSCSKVTSIAGAGPPKQSLFSVGPVITARVTGMQQLESIQTHGRRYSQEDSAHRQKERETSPRNKILKQSSKHLPVLDGKATCRTSKLEEKLKAPQCLKAETLTFRRSSGELSPRLRQNLHQIEDRSHAIPPSSAHSTKFKNHSSIKVTQKGSQHKKLAKSKYTELTDEQLSEFSSETRFSSNQGDDASVKSYSNTSLTSQTETEIICLPHSINTTTRQHTEQPSPVSVLDDTFYSEGSPSPVKNISTGFRDERPIADEEDWHFENMKHFVPELRLLNREPDETARNNNEKQLKSPSPDNICLNKTMGLFKSTGSIPIVNQIHPSCHLINPDIFDLLEQMEEFTQGGNSELTGKNHLKFDSEIEQKIVLDMINEVLVRKINSGRLFTMGRKRIDPEELMKEVHLEVERVQRLPSNKLDTEEDELTKLTTADMMCQYEDWTKFIEEIPAIVLDIERQVFKDLISEVITSELINLHYRPKRQCRQLFTSQKP